MCRCLIITLKYAFNPIVPSLPVVLGDPRRHFHFSRNFCRSGEVQEKEGIWFVSDRACERMRPLCQIT